MQQIAFDIFPKLNIELWQGDCLDLIPYIKDCSIDLVFVDPPYNIKKAEWDKIDNYQAWCELWIAECSRVLKPNGAFWVSHKIPKQLVLISDKIEMHGRTQINWITWDKFFGKSFFYVPTRSFEPMVEFLIYHADEGEWTSQCDKERGFIFESLRAYLENEILRSGWTKAQLKRQWMKDKNNKSEMPRHWLEQKQFEVPTKENYEWLRNLLNKSGELKYLRREYEDLRQEYEDMRYTFNNPGKMSSVWQIPPAKANGHPTPKPEELLKRIIEATSNEGDIVLDPMMGSGTTGKMAKLLNRNFIGIEKDPEYFKIAKARLNV